MKILFWILAITSLPVGLFMSFVSYMAYGLDLAGTKFGVVVCFTGMISLVVSLVCVVLGFIKMRKGEAKKAVLFALIGVVYSVIILVGMVIDEAAHGMLLERDIAKREEQIYGENWDAAPAVEGIPELYQEELNKFYVAVQKEWPSDQLMDLAAMTMADYYGDAPLDNIGFILMDVNGDGANELMIGTTAPMETGGTAIFCMYSDPENPFITLQSFEGETYYLHNSETNGAYMAEIDGRDAAWLLGTVEGESIVDITYQEGAMDPSGRLTLEMIPFSQYK